MIQKIAAIYFSLLLTPVSLASDPCGPFFSEANAKLKKQENIASDETAVKKENKKKKEKGQSDLKSFGRMMTSNMILRKEQAQLFELYRRIFLGNPTRYLRGHDLKDVYKVLKKYPKLSKPPFREMEISKIEISYPVPVGLDSFVKSILNSSGKTKGNLLQIEANIGFWRELLLRNESQSTDLKSIKERVFKTLLDQDPKILEVLNDAEIDLSEKSKKLLHVLRKIQLDMDSRGLDTQGLRQSIVDLIHAVSLHDPVVRDLLKSKSGLKVIDGLRLAVEKREASSLEIGFSGGFQVLMNELGIGFPTGLSKNADLSGITNELKEGVLRESSTENFVNTRRVRPLSIIESAFRSCLGADCSTEAYFDRALDPNYIYFTLTDFNNHSSGHITLVLGTAMNKEGRLENVAFVDKVQNIETDEIVDVLAAISKSVGEKGYKLGLHPVIDALEAVDISNYSEIRYHIGHRILPRLTEKLENFVPHPHHYDLDESIYTRADSKPPILVFNPEYFNIKSKLKEGRIHKPFEAPKSIKYKKLLKTFSEKADSEDVNDVLTYISFGQVIDRVAYSSDRDLVAYKSKLVELMQRRSLPYSVRKQAFFEKVLLSYFVKRSSFEFKEILDSIHENIFYFSESERVNLVSEIRNWSKSTDYRKSRFSNKLFEGSWLTVANGQLDYLQKLLSIRYLNINSRNESGYSLFVQAAQAHQTEILDWMMKNPSLDLSSRNKDGLNDLEVIRLLGHSDLADKIEHARPEFSSQRFHLKSKDESGNAIAQFVSIPAGKFGVYRSSVYSLVTIKRPFKISSVPTTQMVWREVLALAKEWLALLKVNVDERGFRTLSFAKELDPNPSFFHGDHHPVEQVSFNEVSKWLEVLNYLSLREDQRTQDALSRLLPGHKKGNRYRLPDEIEWEYVARLGGVVKGDFSEGSTLKEAGEKNWNKSNSDGTTHPVGLKEPIFFNGQPIYDFDGNVSIFSEKATTVISDPKIEDRSSNDSIFVSGNDWDGSKAGLKGRVTNEKKNKFKTMGFRLAVDEEG